MFRKSNSESLAKQTEDLLAHLRKLRIDLLMYLSPGAVE